MSENLLDKLERIMTEDEIKDHGDKAKDLGLKVIGIYVSGPIENAWYSENGQPLDMRVEVQTGKWINAKVPYFRGNGKSYSIPVLNANSVKAGFLYNFFNDLYNNKEHYLGGNTYLVKN